MCQDQPVKKIISFRGIRWDFPFRWTPSVVSTGAYSVVNRSAVIVRNYEGQVRNLPVFTKTRPMSGQRGRYNRRSGWPDFLPGIGWIDYQSVEPWHSPGERMRIGFLDYSMGIVPGYHCQRNRDLFSVCVGYVVRILWTTRLQGTRGIFIV